MRLTEIEDLRCGYGSSIQELPTPTSNNAEFGEVKPDSILIHESFARRLRLRASLSLLKVQQQKIRRSVNFKVPFAWDLLCLEERFAREASLSILFTMDQLDRRSDVLIPGCGRGGEDVQFWLRRGAGRVEGFDIYNLTRFWEIVVPALRSHFDAQVNFRQASIEELPYEAGTFDLVASDAMLEHVRNLNKAVEGMARVLRPGALAWHSIGPLYYCHGGDHCISSYGLEHGYDHLLLEDGEYQALVNDQEFYDTQPDPNCNYWAKTNQFSFLKPEQYLGLFSKHFNVRHVVVKLSSDGLKYREKYPNNWDRLRKAGCTDADLLIKGIVIIMEKARSQASI